MKIMNQVSFIVTFNKVKRSAHTNFFLIFYLKFLFVLEKSIYQFPSENICNFREKEIKNTITSGNKFTVKQTTINERSV